MQDISSKLIVLCSCFVAIALASVFFPHLLLKGELAKELGRTRGERYLFWQRVFMLLFGAASLLTGLTPPAWRLYVGVALFAAVLVGYLACNKRLTDWYLPWM